MNRSRITGNLTSHGILYSDIANDRVGIGSTIPGNKLSLPDDAKIGLGNAEDLTIYHAAGAASHINNTGLLNIDGTTGVRLEYNNATRVDCTSSGVSLVGDVDVADKIIHTGDTNTAIRFPAADTFTIETAGPERLRISSDGHIFIGNEAGTIDTTARLGEGHRLQLSGLSSNDGISVVRYNSSYGAWGLNLGRSKSNTLGTNTSLGDNDDIGHITFWGADGSDFNKAAQISAEVDGSPSDGTDMPGALVFKTSAEASGTPTERLRIHADGEVECKGGAAGQNALLVSGNYSGSGNADIQTWQRIGGAVQAKMIYKDADTSMHFGTDTAHKLCLMTGGTERLRIDSSGRLLLGSTKTYSDATWYDDITINNSGGSGQTGGTGINLISSSNSWGSILFGDNNDNNIGAIKYDHNTNSLRFVVNTTDPAVLITSAGNVGIGDDSPGQKLNVKNAAACIVQAQSTNSNTSAIFQCVGKNSSGTARTAKFCYDNADEVRIITDSAIPIKFMVSNAEKMRVHSDGKIGVGVVAPVGTFEIRDSKANLIVAKDGLTAISNTDAHTTYDLIQLGAGGGLASYSTATATADTHLVHNAYRHSGGSWKYKYADTAMRLRMNSPGGAFIFDSAASGSAGGTISFSETLRITSGGNVKIGGHTSGSSNGGEDKLNIKGSGSQFIYIGSDDASGAGVYFDGDSNGDMSGSDYARIMHNTDGYLQLDNWKSGAGHRFAVGGNTRLQIESDGDVSVNTDGATLSGGGTFTVRSGSTAGWMKLHGGSSNHGGQITLYGGSNTGGGNGGDIQFRGGSGSGEQTVIAKILGDSKTLQVENTDSGKDAALNIYKSNGSDSDLAILRVGYDSANCYSIHRQRNSAAIVLNQTQGGGLAHHQNTGDDTMILTNRNSVHIAKLAPMVISAPHVQGNNTWGGSRPYKFVMRFSTGNFSASYHVARMISQHDWGFTDWEARVYHDYYSPATNTGAKHRYTGYYSSHTDQVKDYNQNSSGSGTGDSNYLNKNSNLGPGGAHKIHESANGGYYRDAYATDYYVSLGVYSGVTVEIKVNNPGGWLKDQATSITTIYPATFGNSASQSDANSWSYGRGLWFNVRPGVLDSSWWNHSSNFGQQTLPTS